MTAQPSPAARTVQVELDRPRELRLTFLEGLAFNRATSISIARDGVDLLDLDEEQFCELVRCCASDPDLTTEVVAAHIHAGNIAQVLEALAVLVADYLDQGAEAAEGEGDGPLAAAGATRRPTS